MEFTAFLVKDGRVDRIRTCDPLHPMQVRYQTALQPERYWGSSREKELIGNGGVYRGKVWYWQERNFVAERF